MKKKILLGSVGTGTVATVFGLTAVGATSGHSAGYALCFGLLSICLFFVGLAFPKE